MIDIFIQLNLPIVWTTPAGLKIKYTNIAFKSIKVKGKLLHTSKMTTIKLPTDNIDKLTMKRSFMPNFIHSLDASNVHLLLIKLSKIHLPVYTIHDCFAGTPNNMLIMEKLVKEAFIDIYFKDQGYLTKLHTNFVKTIIDSTDPITLNKDDEPVFNMDSHNIDNDNLNNIINTKYVIDRSIQQIIEIPELPAWLF